jgi:hypothetical protein
LLSEERASLRRIRRLHLWLLVVLLAYLPALLMIRRLAHAAAAITVLTLGWAIALARLATRLAFSHCPRCGRYFHAAADRPSYFHLLTRSCMQCSLRLHADRVIYPGLE